MKHQKLFRSNVKTKEEIENRTDFTPAQLNLLLTLCDRGYKVAIVDTKLEDLYNLDDECYINIQHEPFIHEFLNSLLDGRTITVVPNSYYDSPECTEKLWNQAYSAKQRFF